MVYSYDRTAGSRFRGKPLTFNEAFNVLSHQYLYELAEELLPRLSEGGWSIYPNPTSIRLINKTFHRFISLELEHKLPFTINVNVEGARFSVAAADLEWTASKIQQKLST